MFYSKIFPEMHIFYNTPWIKKFEKNLTVFYVTTCRVWCARLPTCWRARARCEWPSPRVSCSSSTSLVRPTSSHQLDATSKMQCQRVINTRMRTKTTHSLTSSNSCTSLHVNYYNMHIHTYTQNLHIGIFKIILRQIKEDLKTNWSI